MKVILSRKGFDSANGGIPSPIMPDGTLLSLPIPHANADVLYSDIAWSGIAYSDLLAQLNPQGHYNRCHLDPDIRDNRINHIDGWQPVFGQTGAAQGKLRNANVESGDIILFFGWFRGVELVDKKYRYARRNPMDFYQGNDLQVIYGYMQIGEIVTNPEQIREYYWHPHAADDFVINKNNAMYLPTDKLSFLPEESGFGTLDFRKDRVLTKEGCTRATWNEYPFLMPEHIISKVKNSSKGEGLYYAGIWQEIVVLDSPGLMDWVKSLLS